MRAFPEAQPLIQQQQDRSRCALGQSSCSQVLAICVFCAGVVTLVVALFTPKSLLNQQPQPSPVQGPGPGPSQPQQPAEQRPSAPGHWLLCQAPGQCGSPPMERWAVSPPALAARVPSFSTSMPGIPDQAFRPVAERWSMAPPSFRGSPVLLSEVFDFVRTLLGSNPFGTGDEVPFVDFRPPGEGKVVAISQRQLAFLIANVVMGNTILTNNGLSALVRRCSAKGVSGFLYSLLSLLAVLARELGPGEQGSMLIGATPKALDQSWRQRLAGNALLAPTVCEQQPGGGSSCSVADFMSGGTAFQALTDIAGGVVGGGAQLCDVADSQDESLVQFYSEVLAFAFFTAVPAGAPSATAMLPVPFVLLGARRYVQDISGQATADGHCGVIGQQNWLNEGLPTQTVAVPVGGKTRLVPASAFVAVASVCSGCVAGAACSPGDNMNNQCDAQRRHLDDDLGRWYQAYEATMYDASIQDAFRKIVRRVGTGPWGAGVWYGDSQQYFLTVWLATSLLSGRTTLDYYAYERFCENPGNQCFVLGASGCADCVARSGAVQINAANCGQQSYRDMISKFENKPGQALYAALKAVAGPPKQVFDLLAVA